LPGRLGTFVWFFSSCHPVFCSERERLRGDQEIWEALDEHTIGVKEGASGMKVKFAFDTVFGGKATNKQVMSGHNFDLNPQLTSLVQ